MKRMLSGIKPTGRVTLGNYIGAIKPFVSYQDEYEMIVFVANLHSMTIYQEPKDLRKNTKECTKKYMNFLIFVKLLSFVYKNIMI